jgi:hypothetical protein
VRSIEEAVEAVDRIQELDRLAIRQVFDQRFTVRSDGGRLRVDLVAGWPGSHPTRPFPLASPLATLDRPSLQLAK